MNTSESSCEQKVIDLENELQQMEEALDRCKKTSDEFIDIASHDLKAPMRKLRTFSERLVQKSKGLNEDAMIYVEKIDRTVASMQSLVDGLTALANIGTEFDFVSCDLNETVNEVLTDFSDLIKKEQAQIHVSDLPIIDAVKEHIKELFKNLFDNALKFQPTEHITKVTISSKELGSEEKIKFNLPVNKVYFQIKFADNGIGFNDENADMILKPFVRLHGNSSYPGSGFGLAFCKKIIDMHSGIFIAKGKENNGSVFTLILPQIHQ
jgi:light-regulated signal transduction histidine kinase (bacteriophytochrome)